MRTNFEPGRRFCSELDYQAQLDAWTGRANARTHRTIRAVPAERLKRSGNGWALPERCRRRTRLRGPGPQEALLRFETNDYSLDPRMAAAVVEVRVSQRELRAVALDTGELAARHQRSFAKGLTFTDPPTSARRSACAASDAESPRSSRPLARYDALIPA